MKKGKIQRTPSFIEDRQTTAKCGRIHDQMKLINETRLNQRGCKSCPSIRNDVSPRCLFQRIDFFDQIALCKNRMLPC